MSSRMWSLQSGLVGYWPLHEASGDAQDVSGAGLTLTDTNTVTAAEGKVVTSRQFTAANSERFALADNAIFSGDVDMTWWAWVYLDTLADRTIFSKWQSPNYQFRLFYDNTAARFNWYASGTGTTFANVADNALGAPAINTWYLIRAWHDSVNNVIGVQTNLNTQNTTAHTTGIYNGTASLMVGAVTPSTPIQFWDGRICELGFSRRLLTSAEWLWLYNNGLGRTYPFDGTPSPVMLGRHPAADWRRNRLVGVAV